MPAGSHKTRLTALNVPPMGLFFPMVLVPDAYPPPPSVWFRDYEDMLEDTWHMEFPRRPELSDSLFPNMNTGYPMWDGYPAFSAKPKKEEKVGLAKVITSSILSTGWWSGFDKRSCSCSGGKTGLERERMALELEEEKKAQAEREKMVQQQAKKIENLSSMVLYTNRDENRDRFKKVRRRDRANSRTQDKPPILPSHASWFSFGAIGDGDPK